MEVRFLIVTFFVYTIGIKIFTRFKVLWLDIYASLHTLWSLMLLNQLWRQNMRYYVKFAKPISVLVPILFQVGIFKAAEYKHH